jgi:hypothetical protein
VASTLLRLDVGVLDVRVRLIDVVSSQLWVDAGIHWWFDVLSDLSCLGLRILCVFRKGRLVWIGWKVTVVGTGVILVVFVVTAGSLVEGRSVVGLGFVAGRSLVTYKGWWFSFRSVTAFWSFCLEVGLSGTGCLYL